MTAKTNAQKQADYRARLAAKGLSEVRGIMAPHDLHEVAKDGARFAIRVNKPIPAKPKQEKQK